MKKKLLCSIIFLCLSFIYSCENTKYTATDQLSQGNKVLASTPSAAQGKLVIVHSTTVLKRGDIGIITIQGEPGVQYTIKSSFNIGSRNIPVTQMRISDSKGLATFNWVVGGDTEPGTYPITIFGGGETLNLSHTVVP